MAVEVIRLVPSRLIVGIACVVIAAIPLVITPFISPQFLSIMCNDVDASYPFRRTTLAPWLVFVIGYAAAFCLFLSMGLIAQYHPSYILPGRRPRVYYIFKKSVPRVVVEVLRGYATYVFGTFLTLSITEIIKIVVGRPRPDFWAVCNPVFIVNNTRVPTCTPGTFIDQYECRNTVTADVRDSRLSFLSGHTSFSFYCATYLACYLERKFRPVQLPCLRLLLQVILFFLALLVGLSRIVDNQHHWSDVLAGAILGMVLGYYTEQLIKADLFGRGVVVKGDDENDDDMPAAMMNMADVDDSVADHNNSNNGKAVVAAVTRSAHNGNGYGATAADRSPKRARKHKVSAENVVHHHAHTGRSHGMDPRNVYPHVVNVDETHRH